VTLILPETQSNVNGVQKLKLLAGATPLEPLHRLGAHLGLKHLYVKRDDEGGRGSGGNKIRKFERQLAKMLADGHDTVIIAAHHQSNAARELAGTAARLGIRSVIVVKDLIGRKTTAFSENGNRLLLKLLGTELVEVPANEDFSVFISQLVPRLELEGARPFVLPFGSSDVLGSMGYMDCANEILEQLSFISGKAPDVVIVPTGSGGTQAGLVAGFAHHKVNTKVIGFSILNQEEEAVDAVEKLTKDTLGELGIKNQPLEIFVDDRVRGEGYGQTTADSLEAIRLTAQLEGLFLDPVYTGKAMAGLISQTRQGLIDPDQIVVFVHTGGLPLLFAYVDAFKSEE